MKMTDFTGFSALVKLAIRRDRIKLSVWVVVISLMTMAMTASYTSMLSTEAELVDMIKMWTENPVFRALGGPASGASIGAFTMIRASAFIAVLIALMSIQAVVRHTRENEETGRAEMIGSTGVGRHASLAAAVFVTVTANVILAVFLGLAFLANSLPASGSFAAGAALGGLGIAFTGFAAVFAQVSETSRGAKGMTYMTMAGLFLVNALGNIFGEALPSGVEAVSAWPVWLSPFGWYQQMHAFHQNNWWVIVLPLLFLAVSVLGAIHLINRRDVGLGLVSARKGRPTARPGLLSPLGLAWRLQRGTFIAWAVSFFSVGVVFGSVRDQLGDVVAENEQAIALFGGSTNLGDYFLATLVSMIATVVVIYTIQILLRMHSEEAGGRAEPVLATAVNRYRWVTSHVIIASLGSFGMLFLLALGTALGTGEAGQFSTLLKAVFIQAPAILVMAGLAITAYGFFPRWATALSWAMLALGLIGSPMLAGALNLPEAVTRISPFTYIPAMYEEITAAALLALIVTTVILVGVGMTAFRRRNLIL